jgi:predicted Zn-dependent protease
MEKGQSVLDLTSLISQVDELEKKLEALNKAIGKNLLILEKKKTGKGLKSRFEEINACLMGLSRILIPVLSSEAGKYGQDPMGTKFTPIPALQLLKRLNVMNPDSEEYRALYTHVLRERNRVSDAVHSANRLLEDTLSVI